MIALAVNPMKITVVEHEPIRISRERDIDRKCITKQDAEYLRQIEKKNNATIFDWGDRTLSPQQWVGIISTPDVTIEVLPKISNDENEQIIKEKLIYMMQTAYDIPYRKNIEARMSFGFRGFIDILASIFFRELERQLLQGLPKAYAKVSNNRDAVKGSINFTKHINKNVMMENKFFCRYSVFSEDTKINQVIKYTLFYLERVVRESRNKTMVKMMQSNFEHVSFKIAKLSDLEAIVFDRNTVRYKEIIDYCKIFLDNQSLQLSGGEHKINFMMFDMNKLFEKFIYQSFRKVLKQSVFQNNRHFLLQSESSGSRKINLKPDIFIKKPTGETIILDTKWKNKGGFASEQDAYQMNAYLTAIPNVSSGILLYPKSTRNDTMIGSYVFKHSDQSRHLNIKTVDLTLAGATPVFSAHLLSLLD